MIWELKIDQKYTSQIVFGVYLAEIHVLVGSVGAL